MRIERKMCSSEVGFQLGEQHTITRMNLILLLRAGVPHSLDFPDHHLFSWQSLL